MTQGASSRRVVGRRRVGRGGRVQSRQPSAARPRRPPAEAPGLPCTGAHQTAASPLGQPDPHAPPACITSRPSEPVPQLSGLTVTAQGGHHQETLGSQHAGSCLPTCNMAQVQYVGTDEHGHLPLKCTAAMYCASGCHSRGFAAVSKMCASRCEPLHGDVFFET